MLHRARVHNFMEKTRRISSISQPRPRSNHSCRNSYHTVKKLTPTTTASFFNSTTNFQCSTHFGPALGRADSFEQSVVLKSVSLSFQFFFMYFSFVQLHSKNSVVATRLTTISRFNLDFTVILRILISFILVAFESMDSTLFVFSTEFAMLC